MCSMVQILSIKRWLDRSMDTEWQSCWTSRASGEPMFSVKNQPKPGEFNNCKHRIGFTELRDAELMIWDSVYTVMVRYSRDNNSEETSRRLQPDWLTDGIKSCQHKHLMWLSKSSSNSPLNDARTIYTLCHIRLSALLHNITTCRLVEFGGTCKILLDPEWNPVMNHFDWING